LLDFSVRRIKKQALWTSKTTVRDVPGNSISFEKLLHLCPPAESVRDVITNANESFVFHHARYEKPVSDELVILAERVGLGSLIYFYKRSAGLYEANSSFQNILNESVAAIGRRHTICRCKWGWSNYLGWQQVDPNSWPHWGYICPAAFAANELIAEWGDFTTVLSSRDTKLELLRMNEAMRNCQEFWLGAIANSTSSDFSPKSSHGHHREWAFSPDLEILLNDLISLDMQVHTEELQNWLLELSCGAHPRDRTTNGAEVMLLSRDEKIHLLTWRRHQHG
jgi:hypothetical protein